MPAFNLNDVRKLDPDFLRQQLNYWHDHGFIQSLAEGYYILADRAMDEMVLFMVANKIYEPSYLSLESALAYYGVIPETVLGVTNISIRKTKKYESAWGLFSYRSVKPQTMIGYKVKLFLELEGFLVETSMVAKGAFHCDLRFPKLLYDLGLSPHQQEKILIQLDTVAQGYPYSPEVRILNKFDVFTEIRVTPLNVLLSQKIDTAINRKRPKGRDFYDITFLLSKTKPDFGFIKLKMGVTSPESLREELLPKIGDINFEALADDVVSFLISKEKVKRVVKFKDFWKQVQLD